MFVFYNVENFFDTYDDPRTEDDEFIPGSIRNWNNQKYQVKLNNIADVLHKILGEQPSLIGLAEIENKDILTDIIHHPYLQSYPLKIFHRDSPDPRGIDLGFLYDTTAFKLKRVDVLDVRFESLPSKRSRDIWCIHGNVYGNPILLILNHWPSRYGGYSYSKKFRLHCARLLVEYLRQYQASKPDSYILLSGDFNDTPFDKSVRYLTESFSDDLQNVSANWPIGQGTIKYRELWYLFDQIIVSSNFLDPSSLIHVKNSGVYVNKNLIILDEQYLGYRCNRSFYGIHYIGGYSDHLPIFMELCVKPGL